MKRYMVGGYPHDEEYDELLDDLAFVLEKVILTAIHLDATGRRPRFQWCGYQFDGAEIPVRQRAKINRILKRKEAELFGPAVAVRNRTTARQQHIAGRSEQIHKHELAPACGRVDLLKV